MDVAEQAARLLGGLAVILVAARAAGALSERLRQPAVLGEILAGVLLGNLALAGVSQLDFLATDTHLAILAEIGVVLLLFEVGLESNVRDMAQVGASALAVATAG